MPDSSQPAPIDDTRGLLRRLQSGDGAAADALFAIHRDRLLRAVRLRMPASLRPHLDADDLCQTAILKALRNLDAFEYRGEGTFLAWLVRIAERSIKDGLRAQQRRLPAMQSASGSRGLQPPDAGSRTPSRDAMRQESLDLLERAVDELRPDERELLIDREILGVDLDVLAERTGKSSEAVRLIVYRAKGRLARWFERHG